MDTLQKRIQELQFQNAQLREELQKLQEVTKRDLAKANKKDLLELPGKKGEEAHQNLHSTIVNFLKKK